MLPQERAALVGMTAEAGFVDGVFDQQRRARRAVGIVAIRTGNLARRDRMGGEVMDLRTLALVTGEADFTLRFLRQRLVPRLMNLMAGSARHLIGGMRAALPVDSLASLMTVEASAALHFGG